MTFTIPEAAALLGISVRLAYELARAGDLPARRLGRRRWVVPRAALDTYLEQVPRRMPGTEQP